MFRNVDLGLLRLAMGLCRQIFPEVNIDRHLDLRLNGLAEHDRPVQLVDALIALLFLSLSIMQSMVLASICLMFSGTRS